MSKISIISLISHLVILTSALTSCSDDVKTEFIPESCKVGDTYFMTIIKMKGNVVETSIGPLIIPADNLPHVSYTDLISAIRPFKEEEMSAGSKEVDIAPYLGHEVVVSGNLRLTPYTEETIVINGRSVAAAIHPMIIIINSSKASRSGEEDIDLYSAKN